MDSNGNKAEKKLKEIGLRISKVRQEMGLTQEEFADKYGYARTTLAKLEAGLRDIKSTEIVELAEKLDVSCDYLLGRTMAAAPDNIVQEMVDRYGLGEETLKTLQRLKDSRKNKEDYIHKNMAPNKDWEQVIMNYDIKDIIEHDEHILNLLNLLFTTQRVINEHSSETHGEFIFHYLNRYLFKEKDTFRRTINIAMVFEDILAFEKTLENKGIGLLEHLSTSIT